MGLIKLTFLSFFLSALAQAGIFDALRGDPPAPQGALKVIDFPRDGVCSWLDDQTILCNHTRLKLNLAGDPSQYVLVEYQLDKGEQIQHENLVGALRCVDPRSRRVQFDLERKGVKNYEDVWATGIWGEPLQEYKPFRREKRAGWMSEEWGYINPFSCRYDPNLPTSGIEYSPGLKGTILRESDGVIAGGEWTQSYNFKQWKIDNPNPARNQVKVIFEDPRVNNSVRIQSLPWLVGGYRIQHNSIWAINSQEQFWFLKDNKIVKRYPLMAPGGPPGQVNNWRSNGLPYNTAIYIRIGELMSVNMPEKGWHGIYLAPYGEPDKAVKLSDAVSRSFKVSPNGCRVLMDLGWPSQKYLDIKMKVIDFCKGEL